MDNLTQVDRETAFEVVKSAFFLEDTIKTLKNDQMQLRLSKPQEPTQPMPPVEPTLEKRTITPTPHPPVNPDIKMPPIFGKTQLIIMAVLAVVSFGTAIPVILVFVGVKMMAWSKHKKELTASRDEEIRNSEEYKKVCAEVDEKNRQMQEQLEKDLSADYVRRLEEYRQLCEQHEQDLVRHGERVKKHYEVDIPEWEEEVAVVENALSESQIALKEVYAKNIIFIEHRNHSALLWLTTFLSTTQFDLKMAMERFDDKVAQLQRNRQLDVSVAQLQVAQQQLSISQAQLQELGYANYLKEESVSLAEDGNKALKSVSNLQKLEFGLSEARRHKAKRAAKKR